MQCRTVVLHAVRSHVQSDVQSSRSVVATEEKTAAVQLVHPWQKHGRQAEREHKGDLLDLESRRA